MNDPVVLLIDAVVSLTKRASLTCVVPAFESKVKFPDGVLTVFPLIVILSIFVVVSVVIPETFNCCVVKFVTVVKPNVETPVTWKSLVVARPVTLSVAIVAIPLTLILTKSENVDWICPTNFVAVTIPAKYALVVPVMNPTVEIPDTFRVCVVKFVVVVTPRVVIPEI